MPSGTPNIHWARRNFSRDSTRCKLNTLALPKDDVYYASTVIRWGCICSPCLFHLVCYESLPRGGACILLGTCVALLLLHVGSSRLQSTMSSASLFVIRVKGSQGIDDAPVNDRHWLHSLGTSAAPHELFCVVLTTGTSYILIFCLYDCR